MYNNDLIYGAWFFGISAFLFMVSYLAGIFSAQILWAMVGYGLACIQMILDHQKEIERTKRAFHSIN